jgi:hypothetical protein
MLWCATITGALVWQDAAKAQEKSPLEIKGRIWAQYTYDMTKDSAHLNGFDIYRAYLQAGYKVDDTWSTMLLLDAQRGEELSTTGGKSAKANLWTYLRNAYVQGSDLWAGGGTFRFGLQPMPFIATIDGATKSRWLGKSLTDQVSGVLNSQSAGVAALGSITPMVKYHLVAHNGTEGLTKAGASDSGLAFGTQITLLPFAGSEGILKRLGLTVYNEIQDSASSAKDTPVTKGTNTLAVGLHFESDFINLAIENFAKTEKDVDGDLTGTGATLNLKFAEAAGFYLRYLAGNDEFQAALGGKTLISAGPSYELVKDKVMTALVYEARAAIKAGAEDKVGIAWNWAAHF